MASAVVVVLLNSSSSFFLTVAYASDAILIKNGKKKPRKVCVIVNRKNVTESWSVLYLSSPPLFHPMFHPMFHPCLQLLHAEMEEKGHSHSGCSPHLE